MRKREIAMEIVPSNRIQAIGAYAFAAVDEKVAELKAKGITPIDFGVGDYKEPTPELIREAAKTAIDERADYGYPSYIGDASFREAAATWIKSRFGVDVDPATEVCATIGSKEGVFNFPEAFVNPGDVVLIPSPGYPPYKRGTQFAEGESYFYGVTAENGYRPDLTSIPEDVAAKAKIMWICNPNSPTGAVYDAETLKACVEFCQKHSIILVSDEAYSELYFDDAPHSILEFGRDGVAACFSLSKRSIMTGWRVGFYAGDKRIMDAFKKVKTNIDSGTPTFIQDAATAALSDETHVEKLRNETKEKRDLLIDALKSAGLPDSTPAGSLYIWQKAPEGMSGVNFATKLIEDAHLVTTPGEWISDELADGSNPGAGHVRFAMVASMDEVKTAAQRIRELKL